MAGSRFYYNYRHQADIAHAYWLLVEGGVDPANIVTIMADDLATSPENPYPGQLFNRPGGPDVYRGLPIDYRGENCTAELFLNVLKGNATGVAGMGSGRVLRPNPGGRAFVYFSDHGGPGVLAAPYGDFIYADRLVDALTARAQAGHFREMAVYLEACESGSIFEGLLPPNLNIYATTASNAQESSWATYCPGMPSDPPLPPQFLTCLGDLYSVAWLEDAEARDLTQESLAGQYLRVKRRTSNDFSFNLGSHALQFGSPAIAFEHSSRFEGRGNATTLVGLRDAERASGTWTTVPQREAKLHYLRARAAAAGSEEARAEAEAAVGAEVVRRRAVEGAVGDIFWTAVGAHVRNAGGMIGAELAALLDVALGPDASPHPGCTATESEESEAPGDRSLYLRRVLPLGRAAGAPVVADWACYRGWVRAAQDALGGAALAITQEDTDLLAAFANLCNAGVTGKMEAWA